MSMKRKAGAAALGTASPAPKRSRIQGETPQTTSATGLEFLANLREARDKANRRIAAIFEKLPDRNAQPEWYEHVRMPLSLEMIQAKMDNHQYQNMSEVEGDLKRMIVNWKELYDKNAEPWKDAEKVRKFISTRFKEQGLNPRYDNDPTFVVPPTPLDGADTDETLNGSMQLDTPAKEERKPGRIIFKRKADAVVAEPPAAEPVPGKLRLRLGRRSNATEDVITDSEETAASPPKRGGTRLILHRPSVPKAESEPEAPPPAPRPRRASATYKMPEEASKGFNGKTMTDAQDKILEEMIALEDEDGNSIAQPFIFLPSRELKDYYAAIKHPVSIKGAQKLARGVKGRDKVTGVTLMKTWKDFEDEVSFIWKNAHTYNEDTSEICKLADLLEQYFKQRVDDAKKYVADPPAPKPKVIEKPQEPIPAKSMFSNYQQAATSLTPARYAVDEEALRRQRAMVANGVGSGYPASTTAASIPAPRQSYNYSGYPLANGLSSNMQPPYTTPRPQTQFTRPSGPAEDVKKPWDTWLRSSRPEAYRWPYHTIKEILITSHPSLDLGSKAYSWSLYPWPELNYASHVLPMSPSSARILLSPLFIKPTRDRPTVYHFCSVNGIRQQASSSAPKITGGQASEEDNLYRPVFDIQLKMDEITEIVVECFTAPGEVCLTEEVVFDKHSIIIQPR